MKHKILNNIWLKIAAFLLALIIWIVVMNSEDPINVRTFYNIPITIKNENIITDKGRTYIYNEDDAVVDVTVEAKRSILSRITATDIEAIADFKNLNYDSLVPLTLRIINFQGEYDKVTANPTNFVVNIKKDKPNKENSKNKIKESKKNDK